MRLLYLALGITTFCLLGPVFGSFAIGLVRSMWAERDLRELEMTLALQRAGVKEVSA